MADKAYRALRNATDDTLLSALDVDEMKFIDSIKGTHGYCMENSNKKFKALKTMVKKYAVENEFIMKKPVSPANDSAYYFIANKHADEVKKRGFPEDASMWIKAPFNWKIKEDFCSGFYGPCGLFMFVLTEFLKPVEVLKKKRKDPTPKTPKKHSGYKRVKVVSKFWSVSIFNLNRLHEY